MKKTDKFSIENKIRLFEYSIIELVRWYKENEAIDIVNFNNKNNFNLNKLSLIPYFLVTANGTKSLMLNSFSEFIARDIGNVEKEIFNSFKDYSSYYKYIKIKNERLYFDDDIPESTNKDLLDDLGYDGEISVNHSSLDTIYKLLNHSIQQYKNNNWLLYKYSDLKLSMYCKQSTSWLIFHSLKTKEGEEFKIPNDFIVDERSFFTYNLKDRILSY